MLGAAPLNAKFWSWFGRSILRDSSGQPIMVFHGTRSPSDFSAFETGTLFDKNGDVLVGGSRDPGAHIGPHFTIDPKIASKFGHGKAQRWDERRIVGKGESGGRVIPVYLRIEHPMVFDSDEEMVEFIFEHGESREIEDYIEGADLEGELDDDEDFSEPTAEEKQRAFHELEHLDSDEDLTERAAEELGSSIRHLLQRQGYDSIIYNNTIEGGGYSFVPFEANQVKSAVGNRGTWSRRRSNIRE